MALWLRHPQILSELLFEEQPMHASIQLQMKILENFQKLYGQYAHRIAIRFVYFFLSLSLSLCFFFQVGKNLKSDRFYWNGFFFVAGTHTCEYVSSIMIGMSDGELFQSSFQTLCQVFGEPHKNMCVFCFCLTMLVLLSEDHKNHIKALHQNIASSVWAISVILTTKTPINCEHVR